MANPAPTRNNRQQCWDSRDLYYECLTKHSILAPPGTDMTGIKGPLGSGSFADPPGSPEERLRRSEEELKTDPCIQLRVLEERQKLFYAQAEARAARR